MRLFRVSELTARRLPRDADVAYTTVTDRDPVDLGEHWPALHYALCAEAPMPRHIALEEEVEWDDDSLENVLMGGEPTPYEDGLTVARVLAPADVRNLAAKLQAITPEEMWSRVDDGLDEYLPPEMPLAVKKSTVLAMFLRVQDCFAVAAEAGEGILLYVPGG